MRANAYRVEAFEAQVYWATTQHPPGWIPYQLFSPRRARCSTATA
jgi:hypothetical protein